MVKSILQVSDCENKSGRNIQPTYDPEERYKNVECLAKSLKSYLSHNEITKHKRGPPKDKRICQLNAAYKYIMYLEDNLTDIYTKSNKVLPENCKLLHNTVSSKSTPIHMSTNSSYRTRLENSDMTPSTPSKQINLIHESSTISGSASTSSLNSLKQSSKSIFSISKPLENLRNFENIDASPILGSQNHYLHENEIFPEFENKIMPRKLECSKPPVNSSFENNAKQIPLYKNYDLLDLNNNINNSEKENNHTKSSMKYIENTPKLNNNMINSNLKTPDNCLQLDQEQNSIGRKHYFLRSTNRLKNMLIANNPVSKTTPIKKRTNNTKKKIKILDSSFGSTRSTSIATTPSVPNSNMSTNSSNEFDCLDAKQLIKIELSQEQMTQIYKSNQSENII